MPELSQRDSRALRAGPAGAFFSGSFLAREMCWRCIEAPLALKERSQLCSRRMGPGSVWGCGCRAKQMGLRCL